MPAQPTQARYWILTIPHAFFTPFLPNQCVYIRGQLERGASSDYIHWQIMVAFKTKQRLAAVKRTFGTCHAEPSRSEAANEYVWKEDTRVDGTQFELGQLAFHRNDVKDWAAIKDHAKCGRLDDIPPDVFIQHYRTLRAISADYAQPIALERTCKVYWGPSGVGKSRRAWDEAGLDAYPKDPNTKFWCGYNSHQNVVVDEFRGTISIGHMLRWLDRYPVIVELKGSSTILVAQNFWITSNVDPRDWYPDLDDLTKAALLRRLEIIYCPINMY